MNMAGDKMKAERRRRVEPMMAKRRGAGRSRRARDCRFSANWLLCLLGLVLVTGNPLALALDVLEAPEGEGKRR